MKKRISGRKLKRDTEARKALFRNLIASLIFHGKVKTTEAKAKSIKAAVEKLVTHAKKNGESAYGLLLKRLVNKKAVERLINEIAPKFVNRPGGYIRVLRLGARLKDSAPMVLMAWTEEVAAISFKEPKRKNLKPKTRKNSKLSAKKQEKTKTRKVSKK